MRWIRNLLLAGGVTLVAGAALAAAANAPVKTKDVVLPNGMVSHIRYTGDVAPKLVVTPVAAIAPIALADPFAALDRMAAEMDARTDAMMRQVAAMAAGAPVRATAPNLVAAGDLPAGSIVRYSFVSTSNGAASCSQSVQVTSAGGAQPQVISRQSGDCSKMGLAVPHAVSAPAAAAAPAAPLPVGARKGAATTAPANTI